jgi:membrane-associated protein
MHSLAVNVLDAKDLIASWGTVGLILIIFAETGLLFGFFFPGDTVLFLAGAFAATRNPGDPHISLGPLLVGVAIAAIVGAQVGYLIGRKAGPLFFDRPKSRLFNPKNVDKAHEVLHRYGEWKAIFLARFIPVVRTFMNPVCGVAQVPVRVFTIWNIIGGLVWTIGVTMLGYALGSSIPIDKYIIPITLGIVVLSVIPIVLETRKNRARTAAAAAQADAATTRAPAREDAV